MDFRSWMGKARGMPPRFYFWFPHTLPRSGAAWRGAPPWVRDADGGWRRATLAEVDQALCEIRTILAVELDVPLTVAAHVVASHVYETCPGRRYKEWVDKGVRKSGLLLGQWRPNWIRVAVGPSPDLREKTHSLLGHETMHGIFDAVFGDPDAYHRRWADGRLYAVENAIEKRFVPND